MSGVRQIEKPPDAIGVADDGAPDETLLNAPTGPSRPVVQTLMLSVALWALYVPHYVVLWTLGPRWGMLWVKLAAEVHWLLTFLGAQRSTRGALRHMYPFFDSRLSVSQILRRHLHLKHECFARVRVWNSHGAASQQSDLKWRVNPACVDAVPPPQRDRGVVVVGYHFNFFLLSPSALAQIMPGVDLAQLRYRSWRAVENAASPITRLALKKAMEADRRAGAKVFYIDETTIVQLYRLLRHGGVVAVTADGGAAAEFVEVPFFDGLLRVPSAWAKLAAGAKADILLICDKQLDRQTRDGFIFNHIQCRQTSNDAAYAAVSQSIRILERMIRDEPWGWHPWQRLRVDVGSDGVRRYSLKQYGFESGERLRGKSPVARAVSAPAKPPTVTKNAEPSEGLQPKRPRVAILANSFPPYRVHLHQQIVAQVPEVELWSLATHSNSYQRWEGLRAPESIRPVEFGHGEPTNEQTQQRFALREWRKSGEIIRWLREHEIGAVLCQGCGDFGRVRIIRWCRRQGIPCYITGDFNICTDNHGPLKRWVKRQAYQRAIRWCSGLMPCGELGLKLLRRYGGGDKPAFMFPFVPNVALFENTPPEIVDRVRHRYGLHEGRRRIVFSARMMSVKRPDLALNAFIAIADRRPEWDLVMLGDGELRQSLEFTVPAVLRDRILWTGFLEDPTDVAGFYALSDLLLLPSDYEPWGVVVVEAAAAGLAIVSSDVVGASPELVKPGRNGALFRAGDIGSLAQVLVEVTASNRIDDSCAASLDVYREWYAANNPVAGFRRALRTCGQLPENGDDAIHTQAGY